MTARAGNGRPVVKKDHSVVAVCAPAWRGVTASTTSLFDHVVHIPSSPDRHPDELGDDELHEIGRGLLDGGARHIVLSGADVAQFRLARMVKAGDPSVRFDVLWHSTYVQLREDGQWKLFNAILAAARDGLVHKVGVLKKGMAPLFRSLGCRADFVMNYVPDLPEGPSRADTDGIHLGIWPSNVNYTKLPHAMLAALVAVPDVRLHAANLDQRCLDIVELFGIRTGLLSGVLLPHAELMRAMTRTHLTLSVTFAESCPMLPLESFSVGVPCLVGPTSHLFEDDPYLRDTVVVPYPDRADVIASYIGRALAEREEIVAAYRSYATAYNAAARRTVEDFLR